MFAKLKKKVEESEGTDLHKLANALSSATSLVAEKTFSLGSMKSSDNLSTSRSEKGSTTSLASTSGAINVNESDQILKLEKMWKQRLYEMENEWRAKVIIRDHEKEELSKEKLILIQQKKQGDEEVKTWRERCQRMEEALVEKNNEKSQEISKFLVKLANLEEELQLWKEKATSNETRIKAFPENDGHIQCLTGQLEIEKNGLKQSTNEQELDSALRKLQELSDENSKLQHTVNENNMRETEILKKCTELEDSLRAALEHERLKHEQTIKILNEVQNCSSTIESELEEHKSLVTELNEKQSILMEEKNSLLMRNAELSQQLSIWKQQLQRTEQESKDLTEKCNQLETENRNLKRALKGSNTLEENSEKVNGLLSQISELESALLEKNKTIRLQQQRLSDMKKTLQKELKNQNNFVEEATIRPLSPLPLAKSNTTSTSSNLDEVNFKYLKHVIFKFLTSREYEAQHLTRAVSTLLKLNTEEEKLLRETLEWKMSWFGTRPNLGSGQNAMYIPPSSF